MSPSIEELRAAMESVRTQAQHPPNRLDQVRRRVRRGNRIRVVAGAAATALAVGLSSLFLSPSGGSSGPATGPSPTPSLTGTPATGLRTTEEGMHLITAVKYGVLNQMARLTFTPTGPDSLVVYSCDQEGTIYQGGFSTTCGGPTTPDTPPDEPNGGSDYLDTKAGVPVSLDLYATRDVTDGVRADVEFGPTPYAQPTAPRAPGGWTVGIYSGTCTSGHCQAVKGLNSSATPQKDTTVGLKLLSKSSGTADSKRIPVRTKGRKVALHLVCNAGPAWAITWLDGKMSKPIPCEAAESRGVFWSEKPGRLEIAVFPASAAPLTNPTESDIAKLMKHPDPMGKWTLQVYDHS